MPRSRINDLRLCLQYYTIRIRFGINLVLYYGATGKGVNIRVIYKYSKPNRL